MFSTEHLNVDKNAWTRVANQRIPGHSTARGAVLGAILGAAGLKIPFAEDLCAPEQVEKEIKELVGTLARADS